MNASLLLAGLLGWSAAWGQAAPDVARWARDGVDAGKVLSIAAAWRDGDTVARAHAGVLGPDDGREPDASTQYQLGSITKAFTNLLLAEMVATGDVGYDTTIRDVLGDAPNYVNSAVGDITLGALATHTSGLPRQPANLAPRDPQDPYASYTGALLERGVGNSRPGQPLGDHYAYSNFGVGLLGYLLGKAHGGGYEAALTERVIEPLGLQRSGFAESGAVALGSSGGDVAPPWHFGALAGAGALWGTTDDLLALVDVMQGRSENPFETTIDAALAPTGIDAGPYSVTRVWHTAPAGDATIYWHNGGTGGYRSFVGFRSDDGRAIALLVAGLGDPTGFGLQWLGGERAEPATADYDAAVIGTYELKPGFELRIFEQRGRLISQASGRQPLPINALGDDWYAIDAFDASLRFVREEGEVVAVELAQNGMLQRGERISDSGDKVEVKAITLGEDALAEFVGEYVIAGAPAKFTIRRGGEALEAQLTGQPFLPIFAKGDDVFFYTVVDAELHFERNDAGAVIALTLHQGAIRQRAERVP